MQGHRGSGKSSVSWNDMVFRMVWTRDFEFHKGRFNTVCVLAHSPPHGQPSINSPTHSAAYEMAYPSTPETFKKAFPHYLLNNINALCNPHIIGDGNKWVEHHLEALRVLLVSSPGELPILKPHADQARQTLHKCPGLMRELIVFSESDLGSMSFCAIRQSCHHLGSLYQALATVSSIKRTEVLPPPIPGCVPSENPQAWLEVYEVRRRAAIASWTLTYEFLSSILSLTRPLSHSSQSPQLEFLNATTTLITRLPASACVSVNDGSLLLRGWMDGRSEERRVG